MAKYILTGFADEAAADAAGQIAALQANNIRYIEPRLLNGHSILECTGEEIASFRKMLDDAGIAVSSLGSPIGKYEIEKDFAPHFELFKKAVAVAKTLGTDKMRVFSFFIPDKRYEEFREEVIRRMKEMVAYASAEGITLCHENEANIYGEAPKQVAALLEAVPGLAAVYDSANYVLTGNDPLAGYDACREKIAYFHIKDALGLEAIITPAGEGEGCIKDILVRYGDTTDADVFVSLEPHLAGFSGYENFDDRGLAGKTKRFSGPTEAFAYAASALRHVLTEGGYRESEPGVFTARELKKIRFGILGVGNQGTYYTKLLTEGNVRNGCIGAIADFDEAARNKWLETFGPVCPVYNSLEEMLASGNIDCLLVEIPHYGHSDAAIASMRAGIPAIVDKPAGVYTLQVEDMYRVQKETGVLLGMMFNQRTNPIFRKMKQMIADGELGEIKRASWIITTWYRNQAYYDSGAWRGTWDGEGGGVLYNQAPHQLDLFQWILGMTPCRVHSFCHYGKWHRIDVEDDVTTYVEFPNGATGTFITTTADFPGSNRFEITGTRGTLIFDTTRLTFSRCDVDEREFCFSAKEVWAQNHAKTTIVPVYGENSQHVGILNNVADTLLGLCELYAPGTDGINGVAFANAQHLSSWEGKTVEMPIDGKRFYKLLSKKIKAAQAAKKKKE